MAAVLLEEGACARLEDTAARNRFSSARAGAWHELPRIHRRAARYRRSSVKWKRRPRMAAVLVNWIGSAGKRLLCLREVLRDEVPVDQVIEERLHKIGATVLEVEVIGMFPHVAGQQRGVAVGERGHRVGRAGDRQLAAAGDEPRPAAAELTDGARLEIVL